jgi:hypothetical protein
MHATIKWRFNGFALGPFDRSRPEAGIYQLALRSTFPRPVYRWDGKRVSSDSETMRQKRRYGTSANLSENGHDYDPVICACLDPRGFRHCLVLRRICRSGARVGFRNEGFLGCEEAT